MDPAVERVRVRGMLAEYSFCPYCHRNPPRLAPGLTLAGPATLRFFRAGADGSLSPIRSTNEWRGLASTVIVVASANAAAPAAVARFQRGQRPSG